MEQEINLQEEVTNAKIRQYAKKCPDWLFVKKEKGWAVVINGKTCYIAIANESVVAPVKEKLGIDIQGEMYIHTPNFYPSGESRFHTFLGRPGDALQAIRDGQGDAFRVAGLFGGTAESVLYFFNREVGEKLRQITIEGFKDAEFKYVVALELNSGFGYTYLLGDNDYGLSRWDYDKNPVYFDEEKDAKAYCETLEARVQKIMDSLTTEEKATEWMHEHYEDRDIILFAVDAEISLKYNREESDNRKYAHWFEIQQKMIRN